MEAQLRPVTMLERSRFERELEELDLPGKVVVRIGPGETPPKPVRLTHHHVRRFFDPGVRALMPDPSPSVMTPATMKPGYVLPGDPRRRKLQGELDTLLRTKYGHALSPKVQLRVGLVDLTEAKQHTPIFGGFWAWGAPPAGQMVAASLIKILPLYALYQLRFDLHTFARDNGIEKGAALRAAILTEWKKAGLKREPALTELFRFVEKPGKPVEVKLPGTPDVHGNLSARNRIIALGFDYIGSVALQSGLFDEVHGGLWLNAAYLEPAVTWTDSPFPNLHSRNGSALAVATFFTLLAQGRLVDQATSDEIAGVLRAHKCMKNGLIDGIKTLPGFPTTSRGTPATPSNKCGVLGEQVENGKKLHGPLFHEAVHIVRTVPAGRRLEYVAAVLTEEPPVLHFPDLGRDLDALIAAQN